MSEFPPRPADATRITPLEHGSRIAGRYELDAPIASGGMATVWRATDTVLTRPVAIKILHGHLASDPEFVARFRREAVAAARLSHPNIVATYDTFDDPECIVMELVDGRTLRDELDRRGFLPPVEVVAIGSAVCLALEAAHQAGLVHRDVKPANVLLSRDGRAKVADFGIAKAGAGSESDLPDLTKLGRMVGTAKYLAPEQVQGGPVDGRTDLYSLGVLLYEAACGRAPFAGDNDLAVATARLNSAPDRPRSVLRTIPPRLDEIIMRAMASAPADRYQSAAAMWSDLQSCPTGDDAAAPRPVTPDSTRVDTPTFAASERSWLVPSALLALVFGALVLAWLLIGGTEARRDIFDFVDRVTPRLGGEPEAAPIDATASAFDPLGDGAEHDAELIHLVDDDPSTAWQTERYGSRTFGGLKPGVGVVLDLGSSRDVDDIAVTSPHSGWRIDVYAADTKAADLAGWGGVRTSVTGDGARTVPGDPARYVLLWITDLGDDLGVVLELSGVAVRGT